MKIPISLSRREVERGLRLVHLEGLASHLMVTMIGGVILVAFALELGASNLVVGLIAAIPPFMQLLQLPGTYLVEKIRKRKSIVLCFVALSRLSLLLPLAILFYPAGLGILLLTLFLHFGFGAIANVSWTSWMKDLIPESRMGPFFSRRLGVSTLLGLIFGLAAAFFIDFWTSTYPSSVSVAYVVLFMQAGFFGLVGWMLLKKTPDIPMEKRYHDPHIWRLISKPFKDTDFRRLIYYLASWNFALNLAAPFLTVYLLDQIGLSLFFVLILQVFTQLVHVLFLRIWGRYSRRHTNKAILSIGTPLFTLSMLLLTFTTLPDTHILTIPLIILIHLLMGISLSGITLASGTIRLKLAPKNNSASYLAAASFANSISAAAAPILGGMFADFFSSRSLGLTLSWSDPLNELVINTFYLQHWDFFFFIAFFLSIHTAHLLSKIDEHGTVNKRERNSEFIMEIKKEMVNLSTMAGLRTMTKFPSLVISTMKKISPKK